MRTLTPCAGRPRRTGLLWLLLLLAGPTLAAEVEAPTPPAERGFSYFMGLGRQFLQYREQASSVADVHSRVRASSPLLVTGALYAVDERWLLSLDSETTFAPGRGTETWRTDSASFNGVTLTDPVLQRNGFSLSASRLRLLGHYRLRGPAFASAGLAARSLSFKRFSFSQGADQAVALPSAGTVEESVAEVTSELGLGLESERVRGVDQHYSLRLSLGLPLWRRLENTSVPALRFEQARGYDLALEGRFSQQIYPHVHLGLWGQWQHAQRNAQTLAAVEMPRSRLDTLSLGLELLWKL